MMFKTKRVAVRVDEVLHERLEQAARKSRRRLAEFVRQTLEDKVADQQQKEAA